MAEGLKRVLDMEVEEEGKGKGEGEEGGKGTQSDMGSLQFLTQEAYLSGTMLVDACDGFNSLSPLVMLWNVRRHWPAGERFAFNCFMH